MGKVIGLGGLFLKSPDPDGLRAWYTRVLGLAFDDWGGLVFLPQDAANHPGAGTVFSPFAESSEYFAPSTKEFMFNLMVDDLESVLARCKVKTFPAEANGLFAHIMDPEGRKIELWQPKPME